MTYSKLREKFAQQGRLLGSGRAAPEAVDRVSSGLPVDLILRVAGQLADVRTIDATRALAKRGATMLKAKRAIEAVVEHGMASLHLPTVEDTAALARDLLQAGIAAVRVRNDTVDVADLRRRLGMTQEQFATVYRLSLRSLQNWEGGQSPDQTASTFLAAIEAAPEEIARALQTELA